ncbi:hypothetical protein EDB19DRAFT_1914559 [Suillus lakei]|nr:hypothetical protein EDB19DRAFT_1914559 [Suillus lakei]
MGAAVEWYRKEVTGPETRASGRTTPALFSPVRIELPGKGKDPMKLGEVATIGVRDGSTLIITVFQEHNLSAVEQAQYAAKLPGYSLRLPMASTVIVSLLGQLEWADRNCLASVKMGDYKKHSVELEEALGHCWYFDTLDSDKSSEQFKTCQIPIHDTDVG